MTPDSRRAQIIIAVVALAVGCAGLVLAHQVGFSSSRRAPIGSLMSLNLGGSVVTIGLALAALGGALGGRRLVVTAAGAGFALSAFVQLAQLGRNPNLLGGNPSTFAFYLGAAVGLLVLARASAWHASD